MPLKRGRDPCLYRSDFAARFTQASPSLLHEANHVCLHHFDYRYLDSTVKVQEPGHSQALSSVDRTLHFASF